MEGVARVETDYNAHTATVTFDNEITTVKEMAEILADSDFPVEGTPTYLK